MVALIGMATKAWHIGEALPPNKIKSVLSLGLAVTALLFRVSPKGMNVYLDNFINH